MDKKSGDYTVVLTITTVAGYRSFSFTDLHYVGVPDYEFKDMLDSMFYRFTEEYQLPDQLSITVKWASGHSFDQGVVPFDTMGRAANSPIVPKIFKEFLINYRLADSATD